MPAIKVTEIINRVELVLQDTNIRWPRIELQTWLNEAYLAILGYRPDANTTTGTYTCTADDTRQNISAAFPTALRLIDVVRNVAATSDKRSVRHIIRSMLDEQRPTWHAETSTVNIEHFMFDPRLPKEFFVYPPPTALAQLEIMYSQTVTPHALTEAELTLGDPGESLDTILIDDIYASALVDWILYRSYSKDADYAANSERAAASLNSFTGALGVKNQTDSAVDPKPVAGGRT